MTITLKLPEDIVKHLTARGEDLTRAALEAVALEGYRSRTLSEEQVRRLLEFETRMQVHSFLKQHGVYLNYTLQDLQHDIDSSQPLPGSR